MPDTATSSGSGSAAEPEARALCATPPKRSISDIRLRRHADYQRVYAASRKYFSPSIAYFFRLRSSGGAADVLPKSAPVTADRHSGRPLSGPRIGLTVGRVMGNAVVRNRLKRRMREALRLHARALSADVDLVLHPKACVAAMPFTTLEREIEKLLRSLQTTCEKVAAGVMTLPPPEPRRPRGAKKASGPRPQPAGARAAAARS